MIFRTTTFRPASLAAEAVTCSATLPLIVPVREQKMRPSAAGSLGEMDHLTSRGSTRPIICGSNKTNDPVVITMQISWSFWLGTNLDGM